MWLRHCIDDKSRARAVLGVIALLALSACGTSGEPRPAPAATSAGADGSPGAAVLPPQGLTLFEQAASVMAAGDRIDAELRFKEFLLQYPDVPAAWVNLAIIHGENGNADAAMDAVGRALAVAPDFAPALNQLGLLHRKNGNFADAEAAYLKAVTVSPEYPLAHYNLAVLNELYLQRLDVALAHFEQYQALVGDDEQVEKWIADLERRVAANQRTANVAE